MTNFETKLSSLIGIVKRSGVVIYVFLLLISLFVAYVSPYEFGSVSLSSKLFIAGVIVLSSLVFLEVLRRILLFVFFEQPFFRKKIPLAGMVFGVLGIALLVSSGLVFVTYDYPRQKASEKEIEAHVAAAYQDAKANLANAKTEALACSEKARKSILAETKTESSECRRTRLGYNSCREGGYISHTQCISIWDYESACNSDSSGNFLRDFRIENASSTCNDKVKSMEQIIFYYEKDTIDTKNSFPVK